MAHTTTADAQTLAGLTAPVGGARLSATALSDRSASPRDPAMLIAWYRGAGLVAELTGHRCPILRTSGIEGTKERENFRSSPVVQLTADGGGDALAQPRFDQLLGRVSFVLGPPRSFASRRWA